jgi:hypothetical protein
MENDNELSAGSEHRGSLSRGDVPVPGGDPPVKNSVAISARDAVTRKIRNPLFDPQATPPLAQLTAPSAPSEPPPRTAAGLVPPIDISENIHPFPPEFLADQEDKSSCGSTRAKHKGLAIVVAVVVAGTAVDIFLWKSSSVGHAKTPQTEAIATSTVFANAVDLPRTAPPTATVPIVEPLPDRRHSEARGKPADEDLALDGIAARGGTKKLDIAKDQQRHVVEASAAEPIVSSKSVELSQDTDLKIGAQKEHPSPRPASAARSSQAAMKPKQNVKVKSSPKSGDEFGMDLRTTTARRPTTTIDESDPYSP